MTERPLDRRDFNKLTAAALGGLAAGTVLGCGGGNPPAPATNTTPGTGAAPSTGTSSSGVAVVAAVEKHLCRGLNECKTQGKDGKNSCRGQGSCFTVAKSSCSGQNECKGLGGCGESAGANECKGKGGCHIPLMEDAWKKVRERKDTEWKEKKLSAGAAPAAAKAD